MAETKRSSKILIYDSRQFLYCIYRAPGDWTNADTVSFIGADGDTVEAVRHEVREKLRLTTEPSEWSIVARVPNPANSEINTIWKYVRVTDSLLFQPAVYGGLMCLKPSALWAFGKMLSPAAVSIMRALPDLFGSPQDFADPT
jgi:hypothetical protein